MPGINTSGKPSPTDLLLGRGKILLGALSTTTGKPIGFRHVGNCPEFKLSFESETLDHQNSRSGVKAIDRQIVLSQKINVSLTLDEILNFDNLAAFLSGTASAGNTNAALTSVVQLQLQLSADKGNWYELVNAAGVRLVDLHTSGLTVKSGSTTYAGATLLVEGISGYEVDRKWGMIFLPSTSTHVNGTRLWIDYVTNATEKTVDQVTMLTKSKQSFFLRFVGINPANADKTFVVDLHSVSLAADGDLPLIGDEFATMTLSGVAEKNELGYPTKPVGAAYYHADA